MFCIERIGQGMSTHNLLNSFTFRMCVSSMCFGFVSRGPALSEQKSSMKARKISFLQMAFRLRMLLMRSKGGNSVCFSSSYPDLLFAFCVFLELFLGEILAGSRSKEQKQKLKNSINFDIISHFHSKGEAWNRILEQFSYCWARLVA
jgi:hypothetical protein